MIQASQQEAGRQHHPADAAHHSQPPHPAQPRPGQQVGSRDPKADVDLRSAFDRECAFGAVVVVEGDHPHDHQSLDRAPGQHRDPAQRLRKLRQRRWRPATQLVEGQHEGRERERHDQQREIVDAPPWLPGPEEEADGDQRHPAGSRHHVPRGGGVRHDALCPAMHSGGLASGPSRASSQHACGRSPPCRGRTGAPHRAPGEHEAPRRWATRPRASGS